MDIDYNEVFGLDTGANEQEPAQPAAGEATENTEAETTETKAEGTAGENETEPAEQSVDKQTPDENAKYAAARRKAEQERDAGIAKAQADAQRQLDDTIKSLGLENPYTGKPITSKAEYDSWKRQESEEKRGSVAEAAGMSEKDFNEFVDNLPQVQEYKRTAEAARQQQQRMVLDEQISQIGKLDPSIKTVEDLTKREEYPAIYDNVRKGISIVDAFKLANFDKLTQSAAAASRQAAINAASSKEHLQATKAAGVGSVTVPADVKATYKALNPDMSDAEIQEHYNRFHKN